MLRDSARYGFHQGATRLLSPRQLLTDNTPIDSDDLNAAMMLTHIPPEDLHQILDISPRQLRRWKNGQSRVPPTAFKLLVILGGYLPFPGWEGWRIWAEKLYEPEDDYHGYESKHIRAIHWMHQELACYHTSDRETRKATTDAVARIP